MVIVVATTTTGLPCWAPQPPPEITKQPPPQQPLEAKPIEGEWLIESVPSHTAKPQPYKHCKNCGHKEHWHTNYYSEFDLHTPAGQFCGYPIIIPDGSGSGGGKGCKCSKFESLE
jgi:hypothetical protein